MTNQYVTILALDDELFCRINGASICVVTLQDYERLCKGDITVAEVKPISEIVLRDAVFSEAQQPDRTDTKIEDD